ncbi:GDSL-type esterase/lipase family protein [Streptomyces durmitorensis]|uniref:GDSL-type esterase/lipase family protein n=1 Tax=Streptomyces durmitorensis TaxID=319947 RepID=A0ABY4Q6X3_9ACTN|nr:GDSL-type esterase/lipase family protein [Streptomyces durmitorensis]UQT61114.1 GDSL-type esterase/lipase family protein [Streptomyces durmitorensis]
MNLPEFTVCGRYGEGRGTPVSLMLIGDSTSLGCGADRPDQVPAALLAAALADELGRPVDVRVEAERGATATSMQSQAETAVWAEPDVVVVMACANDVLLPVRLHRRARRLACQIRLMRTEHCSVVVAACPDLGWGNGLHRPVRSLVRRRARRLARLQTTVALAEGARVASLSEPLCHEDPSAAHAADGFHPSPDAYARAAARLLPAVLAAAGGTAPERESPGPGELNFPASDTAEHANTLNAHFAPLGDGRVALRLRRSMRMLPDAQI